MKKKSHFAYLGCGHLGKSRASVLITGIFFGRGESSLESAMPEPCQASLDVQMGNVILADDINIFLNMHTISIFGKKKQECTQRKARPL